MELATHAQSWTNRFHGPGYGDDTVSAIAVDSAGNVIVTGTTNTTWRIESRDTLTGTNAWQPFTNITLGPSPFILEQPLDATSRFFRGAWVP